MRNGAIDLAKIFSAASLVFFHIPSLPGRDVLLFALVYFVAIAIVFTRPPDDPRLRRIAHMDRQKKLIVPWMFWFCVYAILKVVAARPWIDGGWLPLRILSGPWEGLWFLPFLSLVTGVLFLYHNEIFGVSFKGLSALYVALILGVLFQRRLLSLDPPLGSYIYCSPAIIFGLLVHRFISSSRHINTITGLSAAPLLVLPFDPFFSLSYSIAQILVLFTSCSTIPSNSLLNTLASRTLGIYLVHPIVIGLVSRTWTTTPLLSKGAISFVLTTLVVLLCSKTVVFRRVV